MKRLIYFCVLLSIFWLSCCHKSDVSSIKNDYSPREINYFYEVAFHLDDSEIPHPIRKWNKDVVLFIEGDTLLGDSFAVLDAIGQINNLQLPVRIKLTKDAMQANMIVAFGSRKKFDLEKAAHGIGEVTVNNNVIKSGRIIIVTEPEESVQGDLRRSTILEEITQGLGLMGDSYAYPLSIFYEVPKQVTQLAEIDKRTLKLLYDPAIATGLQREEFEEYFADQLYHVNKEEKLLNYVKEHSVKKGTLEQILRFGLVEKGSNYRVVKFNQPVFVTLSGDTTAIHRLLLQEAIKKIEETSENMKLKLVSFDSVLYDGGIRLYFSKKSNQSHAIAVKVSVTVTNDLLFDKRVSSEVNIDYKDPTAPDQKMPLAIANALYQSICLVDQNAPVFWDYKGENLQLKDEYQEILKLYYSPSLAENMTKEELERVIEQMD